MRSVSRRLLRDEVTVETFTGSGAFGPAYAAPATVRGKVDMTRRLVRDANGAEVVSEMTVYVHPDDADLFPPESLVGASGHTSSVISCATQSRPGREVLAEVVCR
jgi:hypothetical protein